MSRTDTHRPHWVQERDPLLRHEFREDHDHTGGPCDLQEFLADPHAPYSATACRLTYWGPRQLCGCRACTGHAARRRERRRARAVNRALCRDLAKDAALEARITSRPVVKEAWESFGSRGRVRPAAPPAAEQPWPWVMEWWQAAWPGYVAPGRTAPAAPAAR